MIYSLDRVWVAADGREGKRAKAGSPLRFVPALQNNATLQALTSDALGWTTLSCLGVWLLAHAELSGPYDIVPHLGTNRHRLQGPGRSQNARRRS